MRRIFVILFFLTTILSSYGQVDDYGLLFKSVGIPQEQRTSFEVPEKGSIYFKKSLDVEFDFHLRSSTNTYGYIVRVVLNEEYSVDLLINNINNPSLSISLIKDGNMLSDYLITDNVLADNSIYDTWRRVKLSILPSDNKIYISCDDFQQSYDSPFTGTVSALLLFGLNDKLSFATTDVAPIVIKDLKISYDNKHEYIWLFKEHGDNFVFDENHNSKITVQNPHWIIDKHSKWEHEISLRSDNKCFPVFDNKNVVYAIEEDKTTEINLISGVQKRYSTERIADINRRTTQFIYDHNCGVIKAFSVEDNNAVVSTLDLQSGDWSPNLTDTVPARYTHSNIFITPDSSLVQLFGYGFFRFNSKLFSSDGKMIDFSDKVSPRYLSAVGQHGDKVYIFGGVGNKSGKQELGAQLTNDLYEYDFVSNSFNRLWDIKVNNEMEIAAKNLIIMPSDSTKALALFFSPLVKDTSLSLREIDLKEPKINKLLCDKIPYNFYDINSDAMLVYVKDSSKLYAIVTNLCDNGEYEMNIYSILYPIVNKDTYFIEESKVDNFMYIIIVVSILLVIILSSIIVWKYRMSKIKSTEISLDKSDASDVVKDVVITNSVSTQSTTHIEFHPQFHVGGSAQRLPGIYLLGGFCVIDKEQNDITAEFTPLMKQLLSLIIINTQYNGRGISNVKLKELLWFDKSDDKARNNRGVNMNKLRQQLKRVGDFTLNFNKSYWFIEYSDTDYCDYVYSNRLLSNINQIPEEDIVALLSKISEMGQLLVNQTVDFFDRDKADYTNMVIDKLNAQLAKCEDANSRIVLAGLILKFDAVDEDALQVICKSLIEVGKNGIAKTTFDNFIREYEVLFGEPYKRSFQEVVS